MEPQQDVNLARPLEGASTVDLVGRLLMQSKQLALAEIALAKAELKADFKRELHMVEGLGVAAVCALCTVNLLLVSLVFALAQHALPGWAAALVVAAGVLALGTAAGVIGWMVRAKRPLELTRKTLEEDVRWAKERVA